MRLSPLPTDALAMKPLRFNRDETAIEVDRAVVSLSRDHALKFCHPLCLPVWDSGRAAGGRVPLKQPSGAVSVAVTGYRWGRQRSAQYRVRPTRRCRN